MAKPSKEQQVVDFVADKIRSGSIYPLHAAGIVSHYKTTLFSVNSFCLKPIPGASTSQDPTLIGLTCGKCKRRYRKALTIFVEEKLQDFDIEELRNGPTIKLSKYKSAKLPELPEADFKTIVHSVVNGIMASV